jgi:hypothetical protein
VSTPVLIWAVVIFFVVAGIVWVINFTWTSFSQETRADLSKGLGFIVLVLMIIFGVWGVAQVLHYGLHGGFDVFMFIMSVLAFIIIPFIILFNIIKKSYKND